MELGVRATRHAYRGLWREFQIEARPADRREAAAGKSICRIKECLQAERPCSIRRVRKINLDAQLRRHTRYVFGELHRGDGAAAGYRRQRTLQPFRRQRLLKRDGHGERITLRIQDQAVVSCDSNVGRNTGTTRPLSCSIMADCSCMPMRTWSSVQSIRLLWKYGDRKSTRLNSS